MEPAGLITLDSPLDEQGTLARLKATLIAKDMVIFAVVDHAAGAAEVGLTLRPTTVVIFGNAKAGTKLMQADQRLGIDLPLKFLVWGDEQGRTRLSYNDPAWIAERYGVTAEAVPAISAMKNLLAQVARDVVSP